MHQINIHGSIDLSRCGKHGNCIKSENSKFMGEWICLAVGSTEIASNLKIQNSWVNRFISLWEARKMHQIKIPGSVDLSRCGKHGKCIKSKFMGQSICLAVGSTENASNRNSWVNRFVSLWESWKMHQIKIHGSIDLSRCGKQGKCIRSKFMGQSICLAVESMENASNQNSWVNRFVSLWEARKMHQIKIHGSIDLSRLGKHGKSIKSENSKFMGQSICLAVGSTENASNLKIQNPWVNRFVSLWEARKMHQIKIHGSIDLSRCGKHGKSIKSKFMIQSICLAVGSTEKASNLKIQNSS